MGKIIKNKFGDLGIKFIVLVLIFGWIFSGWPQIWQNPSVPPEIETAQAADFQMQTGYYIGNGSTLSITGLGFSPESVIIKSDSTGNAVWKSSAMPELEMAYFSATVNGATNLISLNSDGFSVEYNASYNHVNYLNYRYTWTAFAGSDCNSNGTMCIGTYTGDATTTRLIETGFQPNFVMVKRSTSIGATFKTSEMAIDEGHYFTTLAGKTDGTIFKTFDSTGFTIGGTNGGINNASGGIYYYIAFKQATGKMAVGSYTGDGADNRDIPGFGPGYTPNFVFIKKIISAYSSSGVFMNTTHSYGDFSSYMYSSSANVVNYIQALQNNGFQVGTSANTSGNKIYWVGFGGAPAPTTNGGFFKMANGTYVGNATISRSINGLGFAPDLVIIKGDNGVYQVFKTRLMKGNISAYFSISGTITTGITSLDDDGFTVGNFPYVNSNNITYHWQAFGNAFNPETNTGVADFAIGAYTGNNVDNRDITGIPFQPDLVAIKHSSTYAGVWRSSAMTGDLTAYFSATTEGTNLVQGLNVNGFNLGTSYYVNSTQLYFWFAFKNGYGFTNGTYTGDTTDNRNITGLGFKPDLVWVKRSTAVNGVSRPVSLTGDSTHYFHYAANVSDRIQDLINDGFQIGGNQTETNASGGTYRYAAWRNAVSAVIINTVGKQVGIMGIPSSDKYVGGAFTFRKNIGSANITSITITETGTNYTNLSNVELHYEIAETCIYNGNETRFGAAQSFNSSGKATFIDTMFVDSSQVCAYIVLDVGSGAIDGQALDIKISSSGDVTISNDVVEGIFPVEVENSTILRPADQLSRTAYAIYSIANDPPIAVISCCPNGCEGPVGNCSGYTGSNFCLKNNSTDPDGIDDIANSIWTITGPVSDYSDCFESVCNWTLPSNFINGNYTAQLYVEDQAGEHDTAYKPFTILQDAIADFNCSLSEDGPFTSCETLRASEEEVVYFDPSGSIASQGSEINSYNWTFEDGIPAISSLPFPSANFQIVDNSSGLVTLTITDSNNRSANVSYHIWVTKPLPEWQEAPPL